MEIENRSSSRRGGSLGPQLLWAILVKVVMPLGLFSSSDTRRKDHPLSTPQPQIPKGGRVKMLKQGVGNSGEGKGVKLGPRAGAKF